MAFVNTEKIKNYFFNVWFLWGLCLLLNIITFLFIYFKIHPAGKTLALHYNVVFGVGWYGAGQNLYLLPVAALVVSTANFLLFKILKKYQQFLAELLVFAALASQIIILAAVLFLSGVN